MVIAIADAKPTATTMSILLTTDAMIAAPVAADLVALAVPPAVSLDPVGEIDAI
jgi:hypothetical protein